MGKPQISTKSSRLYTLQTKQKTTNTFQESHCLQFCQFVMLKKFDVSSKELCLKGRFLVLRSCLAVQMELMVDSGLIILHFSPLLRLKIQEQLQLKMNFDVGFGKFDQVHLRLLIDEKRQSWNLWSWITNSPFPSVNSLATAKAWHSTVETVDCGCAIAVPEIKLCICNSTKAKGPY